MKLNLLILGIICIATTSVFAQKFSTKSGTILFEASVPSFEEVKAKNENVSAILNTETGEFASLALVKGFRFKVALMEEHFNENYMESSKFPKAVVKGKLENFSYDSVSEEIKKYKLIGNLTIHGVTKPFETEISISKNGENLNIMSDFILNPGDFDIEIPKIVSNKIADEVNVIVKYSLYR